MMMIIHYFTKLPKKRDYNHGISSVSGCCSRMLDAIGDDFTGDVYVDISGKISFDNSAEEYGTDFNDVEYCPFCGEKIITKPDNLS